MTPEPLIWSTLLILSLCVAASSGRLTRWDVFSVIVASGSVIALSIAALVALHNGWSVEVVLMEWFD